MLPITPMSPFKGRQYPGEVILQAVRWYLRYPLAYRHVSEILSERGTALPIAGPPCARTGARATLPATDPPCHASLRKAHDPPDLWEPHGVPHGAVDINWEKSKAINGETRAIWIYTPPEYHKNTRRYLFHGSNDTAAGWTMAGNANFVLDNLLAGKKLVPMIVVMPWGPYRTISRWRAAFP